MSSILMKVDHLPGMLLGRLPKGVQVAVDLPDTLERVLTVQLGLDLDYVNQRVQTVFLNSKPVDDLSTAVVEEGAVIGLGAAMPGLAGALLRRGGILSTLRDSITSQAGTAGRERRPGRVTLKLFNVIAPEAGPAVLSRGMLLRPGEAAALLARPEMKECLRSLEIDGEKPSLEKLAGLKDPVLVRVLEEGD